MRLNAAAAFIAKDTSRAYFQTLDEDRAALDSKYEAEQNMELVQAAHLEVIRFREALPSSLDSRRATKLNSLSEVGRVVLMAEELREQILARRGSSSSQRPPSTLFYGGLCLAVMSARANGRSLSQDVLLTDFLTSQWGKEIGAPNFHNSINLGDLSDRVGILSDRLARLPIWKSQSHPSPEALQFGSAPQPQKDARIWTEMSSSSATPLAFNSAWYYSQWVTIAGGMLAGVAAFSGVGEVAALLAAIVEIADASLIATLMQTLVTVGAGAEILSAEINLNQYSVNGITEDSIWRNHESAQSVAHLLANIGVAVDLLQAGAGLAGSRVAQMAMGKMMKVAGLSDDTRRGSLALLRFAGREVRALEDLSVMGSHAAKPYLKLASVALSISDVLHTTIHHHLSDFSHEERAKLIATMIKILEISAIHSKFEGQYAYIDPILKVVEKGTEAEARFGKEKNKDEQE